MSDQQTSAPCRSELLHELAGLEPGAMQSDMAQHGVSENHVLTLRRRAQSAHTPVASRRVP